MTLSGGKKILLVDFEVSKMKATEDFLHQAGFEVIKAFDGRDALDKFAVEQPDLVLLSAMLPKLHGFEVCKTIKTSEIGKSIPVIITTGVYKSYKYKRQAMRDYLADDYILKPFNYEELLIKIREHLGLLDSDLLGSAALSQAQRTTRIPDHSFLDATKQRIPDELNPDQETDITNLDAILEDTLSGLFPIPDQTPPPMKSPEKTPEPDQKSKEIPSEATSRITPELPEIRSINVDGLDGDLGHFVDRAIALLDGQNKPTAKTEQGRGGELSGSTTALDKHYPEHPATPADHRDEGIQFGKYFLIKKIGTGGMAEMWKAKQRGLEGFEKIVAIKRILPNLVENEDFITMFIDEGKVAALLTHPNIAQIYELGEERGSYFIAMEYIAGKDLRSILKTGRKKGIPLPIGIAIQIAIKLLFGLHYAHRKKGLNNEDLNIVHRDVSPPNVAISYEGEVKLVDFGIAKAAAKNSVTQTGSLKGKILYMSPEQARGQSVDKRSDIFSVGVLLYEMVTGKKPFGAESEMAILHNVRELTPALPSASNLQIPASLDRIIMKAIEKSPNDRYQTAEDMRLELERFLNSQGFQPAETDIGRYMRILFRDQIAHEAPELLENSTLDEAENSLSALTYELFEEEPIAEEPSAVRKALRESSTKSTPTASDPIQPMVDQAVSESPAPTELSSPKTEPSSDSNSEFPDASALPDVPSARVIPTEKSQKPPSKQPGSALSDHSERRSEDQRKKQHTHKNQKKTKSAPSSIHQKTEPISSTPGTNTEADTTQKRIGDEATSSASPADRIGADRMHEMDEQTQKPVPQPRSISILEFLKNPIVIIFLIVLAYFIMMLLKRNEKQPSPPPSPPVQQQTPTPVNVSEQPGGVLIATEGPTPSPTETPSPSPTQTSKVESPTVRPTEPEKPTVTPTQSASPSAMPTATPISESSPTPTQTPLPTKIPIGTFIEHPDTPLEVINKVTHKMPLAAKKMGVEGTVMLQLLISETGEVIDVTVLKPSSPDDPLEKSGCVKAAREAVSRLKFKPAQHDGVAVKTHYNLALHFK